MRLSVVVIVVAMMAVAVQAETVTYKQGTEDPFTAETYTGQDDARLISFRADAMFGTDAEILLKRTPGWEAVGLVRFDISTMPDDVVIEDATLRLFVEYIDGGTKNVDLYKMLTTWVETTVTWNNADTGVPWDVAGASGAADVEADPSASAVAGPAGGYNAQWTITDLVTDWYNAPAGNHGVRLHSDELQTIHFEAVNFWGDEWQEWGRPELVIEYSAAGEGMGDANLDGLVDDADLSLLLSHWNQDVTGDPDGGWGKGEFDGTAPVQDNDLSLLLANWTGAGGAVPEPTMLSILIAGSVLALKRRR